MLNYVNKRVVAEIGNKKTFAKKENAGLIGKFVIMDEGKASKDLYLYSESGGPRTEVGKEKEMVR